MYGVKHRSARERRFEATGKWFQKTKETQYMWTNHIWPVLLVISLIAYLISL